MCSCLLLLLLLVNPFRRTKDIVRKKLLYVSSKAKNYPLVKNGLIVFKELVLKWRIKFALTQNCVNAVCCLFCLIPSLDSLLIFVLLDVICLALWYILARGQHRYLRCTVSLTPREPCQSCSSVCAACLTRLLLMMCRSFCRLHVPPFSLSPWKTYELRKGYMESVIWLLGKKFREEKKIFCSSCCLCCLPQSDHL